MASQTSLPRALLAAAALFGDLPAGVWLVGADGAPLFVNRVAREMAAHLAPDDGAAVGLSQLRDSSGSPIAQESGPVARALAGESAAGLHLQLPGAGGTPLHLSLTFAPLRAEDGSIEGAVIIAADRTVEYEIERSRDDFLASAAHDLRSPLTAIRGSAQLGHRWLQREPVPREQLERTLQTIDAAAGRLNRMLETLMDSARIARGSLLLQCAPTDLAALVREVVTHHEHESPRHRFLLDVPDESLTGTWDAALLERAVENLVSNAVKYSPGGGEIDVRAAAEGDQVVFAVRDYGVGIPMSALPHIFERFYRAKNALMGEIEGNGLGLFTVKGIITAHGGNIDVWSAEGEGTEMTVRLPRQAPECDA